MVTWGREKKGGSKGPSAYRFFAAGAILVAACLALLSSRTAGKQGEDVLRREEIAAAEALGLEDAVPVMLYGTGSDEEEPPGMINGKWNLWEYIGDRIASALFGNEKNKG